MIKTISLKCPDCNANLSVEDGLKQCFCQYCGSKIMIDDGSTNHTYITIDEAKIKEAEINENIRLRELEIEEKKYVDKKRIRNIKLIISIVSVLLGIIFFIISESNGSETLDSLGFALLFAPFFIWIYPMIFK